VGLTIPKLVVRGLCVRYASKQALGPVTMEIPAFQVTALIGPSGCGKSTFLRALNRMNDEVPGCRIEGDVLLDGTSIYRREADPIEIRRRVGMVFQKANPLPKSIFENVAYGLRISGVRNGQVASRVERALRQAALWDEVKDRLRESALTLSGGQQQRICIARALAVEPQVLLMDEPASALDPLSTERVEQLVVELARSYTVVIVTHNLQQAARIAHHTAFFHLGEMVEFGTTEAVFHRPCQDRTRDYVLGRFG
jgi:phosphate transport system ATP-binding protein